jgi:hypothetical protein
MATQGGPNIVTDGLVLYLDAANQKSYPGSGTVWTDLSGNGNNGTLINGPTFNSNNGGEIAFDGVDDFIITSNTLTLSDSFDWTIQCWISSFQTNPRSSYLRFLGKKESISNFFHFEWYDRIFGRNKTGGTFAFQTGFTPPLPLNDELFLLTMTGNNGIMELYLNTNKTSVNISLSGDLEFFDIIATFPKISPGGRLSTFFYYNRALTSQEIQQNYNATKSRFGL